MADDVTSDETEILDTLLSNRIATYRFMRWMMIFALTAVVSSQSIVLGWPWALVIWVCCAYPGYKIIRITWAFEKIARAEDAVRVARSRAQYLEDRKALVELEEWDEAQRQEQIRKIRDLRGDLDG